MNNKSKLTFFEKNELDLNNSVVITTGAASDNNISTIKDKGADFETKDKESTSFRSINKNIIYNPVFEGGQVNLGQFELIDVTRGEAQKDSQSQSNALTKSLATAFTGVGRIEKNIIAGGGASAIDYNQGGARLSLEPFLNVLIPKDDDNEDFEEFLPNGFNDKNYNSLTQILAGTGVLRGLTEASLLSDVAHTIPNKNSNISFRTKYYTNNTTTAVSSNAFNFSVSNIKARLETYALGYSLTKAVTGFKLGLRVEQRIIIDSYEIRRRNTDGRIPIFDCATGTSTGTDLNLGIYSIPNQFKGSTLKDESNVNVNLAFGFTSFFSNELTKGNTFLAPVGTNNKGGFNAGFEISDLHIVRLRDTTTINSEDASMSGRMDLQPLISISDVGSRVVVQYDEGRPYYLRGSTKVFLTEEQIEESNLGDTPVGSIDFIKSFTSEVSGGNLLLDRDNQNIAYTNFLVSLIPFPTGSSANTLDVGVDTTKKINLNNEEISFKGSPDQVAWESDETIDSLITRQVEAVVGEVSANNQDVNTKKIIVDELIGRRRFGFIELTETIPFDKIPFIDSQGNNLTRLGVNNLLFPISTTQAGVEYIIDGLDSDNDFIVRRADNEVISVGELPALTFTENGTRINANFSSTGGTTKQDDRGFNIRTYSSNLRNKYIFDYYSFDDFRRTSVNKHLTRTNATTKAINYDLRFTSELPVDPSSEEAEETLAFDIESDGDNDFPSVVVNDLKYEDSKLKLILGRNSENAPIPDKNYFNSMKIQSRNYNFGSSSYSSDNVTRLATYEWSGSNPFPDSETFSLEFRKAGTAVINATNINRVVKKSTIRTREEKIIPNNVGTFKVTDIDFGADYLQVTFKTQEINQNFFSSLSIVSVDGKYPITRQFKISEGTITDHTIRWEGFPEFKSLKKNKKYQLKIITGGEEKPKFFIPNNSGDFNYIEEVIYENNKLSFKFKNTYFDGLPDRVFNSLSLTKGNATLIPSTLEDQFLKLDNNTYQYKPDVATLPQGIDFFLNLEIEDLPIFEISMVQATDLVFDTIVILNTNLNQLSITDFSGNQLIDLSDVKEFRSVSEDNERNIVLFLKNPIVASGIKIQSRSVSDGSAIRKLGQVFLMKSIGQFNHFPMIEVMTDNKRSLYKTQLNETHIKTLPESINYNMQFPPLDNEDQLRLAQNLFSRVSDYNEFVVWVNGGQDVGANKFSGFKGFRFKDIVKGLCSNDLVYSYKDGRLTSGVVFNMNIKQVP